MKRNQLAKYESVLEPLELQDAEQLRIKVEQLKQRDGESWAIGEVIERALTLMGK